MVASCWKYIKKIIIRVAKGPVGLSDVLYVLKRQEIYCSQFLGFRNLLLNLHGEWFSLQVYVSSHVKKPRVGRQPLEVPESLSEDINTTTSLDMSLLQNVCTCSIHHLRHIPKSRFRFTKHVYASVTF